MISILRHALTSPLTGPIATAVAVALAVTLGVANGEWRAQQAIYETRIAELTRQSELTRTSLKSELDTCRAAEAAREQTAASYASMARTPEGARKLLEHQPEGIDACARMEAADQAVLSNLKK